MTTFMYFVVIDPTETAQPALDRAVDLAAKTGAGIHLFCCDYIEDTGEFSSRRAAKQACLKETNERLALLAKPLHDLGIPVSAEAYWNSDWHSAILRASSRLGADLIIKTTKPHKLLQRKFSQTSDVLLLRKASCPVLLAKSAHTWDSNCLLAAIALDPDTEAHDILNRKIIAQAQRLAKHTGADLHLVMSTQDIDSLDNFLREMEDDEARSHAEILGERYGVEPSHIHLSNADTLTAITEQVELLEADLLIIGTIARKGLHGMVLGNTAEKILDQLDNDILTIN